MTKTGLKQSEVEVVTNRFETAHGRKPSGRGLWVFEFEGFPNTPFSTNDTYAEAKRSAVINPTHLGARRVYVQP